ncbi:hypothetical protein [Pseudomonas sp. PA15(2017)]|uniref:hypothetical protein n=1 Tax=Pseudomonas sp. PA15(2017) TaxID=1932111 RepID=UPI0021153362|nr:hypothetical protein [Pseudomonas sp. PA15(2017)]
MVVWAVLLGERHLTFGVDAFENGRGAGHVRGASQQAQQEKRSKHGVPSLVFAAAIYQHSAITKSADRFNKKAPKDRG